MANSRAVVALLGILAVFAVGVVLAELRVVLVPFVISLLLSVLFEPLVMYLKKKRFPTFLSLIVVLLALALVVFLLILAVMTTAESFISALPRYEQRLAVLVGNAYTTSIDILKRLGFTGDIPDPRSLLDLSLATRMLGTGVDTFLSMVGNLVLIVLFMLFILAGAGGLDLKIRRAFPASYANRIALIVKNTSDQVRQYLLTKTLVSAGTGFLTYLFLIIFGVDFPILWGVLAFTLNFIPNVGSVVAVALPFVLSLLQFDTMVRPSLVLACLGSMQFLMGNVLEPRLLAFSMNLSPLLILVSLIFWGWLWGGLGMVLAVPLTSTIKIVVENIRVLRPLGILMSDSVEKAEIDPSLEIPT
jgi:AI-2 transport protein TqsA